MFKKGNIGKKIAVIFENIYIFKTVKLLISIFGYIKDTILGI